MVGFMDSAVAAYAMEKCHSKAMITVAIDKCVFEKPAKEGNLVKIWARVERIGNTSATFAVEARSYNVFRGDEKLILSTKMTFVRVDEEGEPIRISEQVRREFYESPGTEEEKKK